MTCSRNDDEQGHFAEETAEFFASTPRHDVGVATAMHTVEDSRLKKMGFGKSQDKLRWHVCH